MSPQADVVGATAWGVAATGISGYVSVHKSRDEAEMVASTWKGGRVVSLAPGSAVAEEQLLILRRQLKRAENLAAKWDRNAADHGARTFTGNDHALFANELRAALAAVTPADGEGE